MKSNILQSCLWADMPNLQPTSLFRSATQYNDNAKILSGCLKQENGK
ncbi:MAG: hypothetical protein J6V99_01340 [Neisseriaceae bacterium]|nr:hypothetical protein [Neisseriaceae bacterium]